MRIEGADQGETLRNGSDQTTRPDQVHDSTSTHQGRTNVSGHISFIYLARACFAEYNKQQRRQSTAGAQRTNTGPTHHQCTPLEALVPLGKITLPATHARRPSEAHPPSLLIHPSSTHHPPILHSPVSSASSTFLSTATATHSPTPSAKQLATSLLPSPHNSRRQTIKDKERKGQIN